MSSRALPASARVRHRDTVKASVNMGRAPDAFEWMSRVEKRLRPRAEVRVRRLVRPPCFVRERIVFSQGSETSGPARGRKFILAATGPGANATGALSDARGSVTAGQSYPAGTRLRPSTVGRTASTVCSRRSPARDLDGSSTVDGRPPRAAVGGLGETRFRRDLEFSGTDVLVMGLSS